LTSWRKVSIVQLLIERLVIQAHPGSISPKCLRAVFEHTNPKSVKDSQVINVFFCFFGFARAKAAHKKLVKSTPGA